jgi:hypothetical protein
MPQEKRPLERPRRRWVHNVRMNFREIEWGRKNYVVEMSGYL